MKRPSRSAAFTIVELLVVIAIIAILLALTAPSLTRYFDRAQSTACAANLRNVGIAVQNFIGDNNGTYPVIESNPDNPVYPPEMEAGPILEVLGPYGVTAKVLQCPSDLAGPNYYEQLGSSYEWRPLLDGENAAAPSLYFRGGAYSVPPSRIRIAIDFEPVHSGRMNRLYGDGRVRSY